MSQKITGSQPCLLLAFLFCFLSCSKKEENAPVIPEPPIIKLPTLSTLDATNITSGSARLNGAISNEGGEVVFERGFCWNVNANPTIYDSHEAVGGSGLGAYFLDKEFSSARTYHVRAYATNSKGTAYGNDITFRTKELMELTTGVAKNITSNYATLTGTISSTAFSTVTQKGFCISTSPNPDINNSTVIQMSDKAVNTYQESVTGLQKNTTYYVRSFASGFATPVYYGTQITFKTVGYIGSSGGYIFFDKGEITNNWRYLEAAPYNIKYTNATYGAQWGCTNTSILQTQTAIGTGLENTNRILSICNQSNAALLCENFSVLGLSDWFLGSYDEMNEMQNSLSGLVNFGTNQVYWTSSEYNATNARNINMVYGGSLSFGVSKSNDNYVRPVRRF